MKIHGSYFYVIENNCLGKTMKTGREKTYGKRDGIAMKSALILFIDQLIKVCCFHMMLAMVLNSAC